MTFHDTAPAPIMILPMAATYEEMTELVTVNKTAFGRDPLMEFCFNRPEHPQESMETLVTRQLDRVRNPQYMYHKAVDSSDPSGPILGTAFWKWIEDPQTEPATGSWSTLPPGPRVDCLDAALGTLYRWRHEHFRARNQPYLFMGILTVLPEAQRRGIGSALLRKGLEEADRRGWPAFVDASPVGLGLYKKFGWEEVAHSTVNLKDYGGQDLECTAVALIRPPGAKEKIKGAGEVQATAQSP